MKHSADSTQSRAHMFSELLVKTELVKSPNFSVLNFNMMAIFIKMKNKKLSFFKMFF